MIVLQSYRTCEFEFPGKPEMETLLTAVEKGEQHSQYRPYLQVSSTPPLAGTVKARERACMHAGVLLQRQQNKAKQAEVSVAVWEEAK